ncbi:restriction endonuclease [Kitasatospora sp. NBC_01287]|uniref:restriction endonuclease n=1 Tax=Kitasatospora sp. NBC_01287 TaxID=2903573 RepID=UPI002250D2DE|nr:restriction endonuclease [Kitasatospora sp. NBC_01287]MCX4745955.1 restriction endonuclease [Kitasatospora sp. NBC_01287]
MARRRIWLRKPRNQAEYAAAGIVALALCSWLFEAARAFLVFAGRHWTPLVGVAAAAAVAAAAVWVRRRGTARVRAERLSALRLTLGQIDTMGDQDFEFALRDLLVRDGWTARKVGQQGDQAADVIGQHPQRGRIVLQAKHTTVRAKVGSQVMYQVKGTAGPAHGADVAVVVTNGSFTRAAAAWGDKHRVHWVDRDRLQSWAEHGVALHDLLRLPAVTARRRRRPFAV